MDLNIVKDIMLEYCEKNNLIYYDSKETKEYGYYVLQVMLDKKGGIDVDTLALANDYLSNKLDSINFSDSEYMLEVSSPGAEKELRNFDEVKENIGEYVHIKTKDMIYEGYLTEIVDDTLNVKINIKGRIKTVSIKYEDVKKIRLAVKI